MTFTGSTVNNATLNFGIPSGNEVVTANGFNATYTATNTSTLFSVSPASGTGSSIGFTVTPIAIGVGTFTITCSSSTATATITVLIYALQTQASGYPTRGMWFDFSKPDETGLPTAGEILGFTPNGIASLRAPQDDGNLVWCAALSDTVGNFGYGSYDLATTGLPALPNTPIAVTFAGKADLMNDVWGDVSGIENKQVDSIWLLIAVPSSTIIVSYTFLCTVIVDQTPTSSPISGVVSSLATGVTTWGGSTWGGGLWTSSAFSTSYLIVKFPMQVTAVGHSVQFQFSETSGNPYTIIGYMPYLNRRKVEY